MRHVTRLRLLGGTLLAALTLAVGACGEEETVDPMPAPVGGAPAETPAPQVTSGVPDETPVAQESAEPEAEGLPEELVGTWVSTGSGGAEIIYEFGADGMYKYAGVLLQQRESGTFSFQRSAVGSFRVEGSEIVLEPARGTERIEDPDVPSASREEPINTQPERVTWALTGSAELQLTDSTGTTITYARS